MHADICLCASVHTGTWTPEVNIRCLCTSPPFHFFETGYLTVPGAYPFCRLTCYHISGILCSPPSQHWCYRHKSPYLGFLWMLEIQTQVSMLTQQVLYQLNPLPSCMPVKMS